MINKQFINERLLLIDSFLKELRELASLDEDTFVSQKRNSAACESFLRRTLEAIFDIGRHILAKTGYIDMSTEYKSIAIGLVEIGVVDRKLEEKLIQMAGYRNRLVHMYNLISDSELYHIIQSDLKDIEEFISAVKSFIQKY
ncbi:DUF86 domain-containing protein [bacterium]|nr:DUF86 domain-containing protein [bacterium]